MISAQEALGRLIQGNARFVSRETGAREHKATPAEVAGGQAPIAVILGCSDSRVPAEMIFDQGLGDLFVIRVAGNVVAPSQIGSVEFAAERFGTRLVVVLGHASCGAVQATLEELERPTADRSPNLHAIVDRIRPALEPLVASDGGDNPDLLLERAVAANIEASVAGLSHGSKLLEQLVAKGDLLIVGAEYSLSAGTVSFLDPVPADA